MKRRHFIKQSAVASSLLTFGSFGLQSCVNYISEKRITILHTNDTHSHIDTFPSDDGKYPNLGGIAKRATLIEQIRKENPNTLLLDAGDIFQGTPYFNYYGGELEFKLMSKLKYDASTIGNHDFDNGIDGLYAQLPHASFDFISANYDFKNTVMSDKTHPHKVFEKNGIKIGVFGLGVELDGLVDKKLYKETVYLDPLEIAEEQTRILKEDLKCDLIICLSHLGYKYSKNPEKICDITLAEKTKNIDLIIGGHTHTFLDEPTKVINAAGAETLVNQVGCYGVNVGRVDFVFTNDMKTIGEQKAIAVN
jgi:5'-nucleotidase